MTNRKGPRHATDHLPAQPFHWWMDLPLTDNDEALATAIRNFIAARDEITAVLDKVRREQPTDGEIIAAEFGLDDATAKRLGFT